MKISSRVICKYPSIITQIKFFFFSDVILYFFGSYPILNKLLSMSKQIVFVNTWWTNEVYQANRSSSCLVLKKSDFEVATQSVTKIVCKRALRHQEDQIFPWFKCTLRTDVKKARWHLKWPSRGGPCVPLSISTLTNDRRLKKEQNPKRLEKIKRCRRIFIYTICSHTKITS